MEQGFKSEASELVRATRHLTQVAQNVSCRTPLCSPPLRKGGQGGRATIFAEQRLQIPHSELRNPHFPITRPQTDRAAAARRGRRRTTKSQRRLRCARRPRRSENCR